ncbi:disease resistance protein RPM1 [Zea mays]|jgi:disease resistance protein RPM1|uniref:Disease resistance protein RPM1 n=1 Tax=Zea mays TaxID=4577 RepID=K7UB77_MAIZE|nr:disease resistance protein RPM1 [Zea mays]XP_008679428.1 disease resistance protein RPM1 [Zea mays]XP_008679429.1 disease resistance protein RPM1 [Zea mays]XP_008679430.1 disease resistance protein RPM1 [Zea mays]AQK57438.1 Disease resistance protein RPM1 [Zea mays]|eukprot:XP_008679427.1 disease resistance protein RPM1 [Zea mays]
MAEAVVFALAKISVSLAGSAISGLREHASIIKELPGKVRRIEAQLSIINGALQQQDSAYLSDHAYMKWIAYIRTLAYQVEDIMDTYSHHAHQLENRGFMWKLTQEYLGPFRSISAEITKIEENLKHATELKQAWLENYGHHGQQIMEAELSQDYIPAEPSWDQDFVGMDGNTTLVTEWLRSASDSESTFMTLLGAGGLGNTTLAMDVYKREKDRFRVHSFIAVERDCTMDALMRKILLEIGSSMKQPPSESVDSIPANQLKEEARRRISKLRDGRCLIVLDNVRDPRIYFEMRDVMSNLPGVRIILTTRKTQVAAARDPSSSRFLQLQPLDHIDALRLFCRKAFFKTNDSKCPPNVEVFATSLVNMCKGLPLAIVAMGGMMSLKPPVEQIWNQACVRLQKELERNADHVQAVLNLSYHDMPGHLRNCLLYCSMFPEDYHMSRESLVRLWIAEGSVLAANSPTPETTAEAYFMELVRRNMLQVVDNDVVGRVSTCKMHDIVRKMVLVVAKEERFASATDYSTVSHTGKDVRHLALHGWKDTNTPPVKFPRLRRLVALGANSCLTKLLPAIFSGSSFLTVLVLQDSGISEVPASIGSLFNLRYISLRYTQVKSLPESVQRLAYLDTLDVRQTRVQRLPQGVGKARKLRHILADACCPDGSQQSEFRSFTALEPPKALTSFGELQTLETVQANKDMAMKLAKMMQLRSVSIDNISSALCGELFASVSELQFLTSLLLSATDEHEPLSFQNLVPKSSYLSRLTVRGSWLGKTLDYPVFKEHGRNLAYLSLSWCLVLGDPLQFLGSHCPHLQYLCLHRVQSANSLVLPERCFRELKNLVLERMPDVSQMKVGDGALQCVQAIHITALPNLDKVPQGMESLTTLKKLSLLDLHNDFIVDWEKKEMSRKMPLGLELRI